MSNLKVSDECIRICNAVKANHAHGFVIMSIKDLEELVLDEAGDKFPADMTQAENEDAYERVKSKLTEQEPKYLVFDFLFETNEGRRDKLAFINWCSDNSDRKKRMLQGSSCEGVKKQLPSFAISIQANDFDELDYHTIRKDALAGKK